MCTTTTVYYSWRIFPHFSIFWIQGLYCVYWVLHCVCVHNYTITWSLANRKSFRIVNDENIVLLIWFYFLFVLSTASTPLTTLFATEIIWYYKAIGKRIAFVRIAHCTLTYNNRGVGFTIIIPWSSSSHVHISSLYSFAIYGVAYSVMSCKIFIYIIYIYIRTHSLVWHA